MNKRFVPKPLKVTNTSRTLAVKCYSDNLFYGEEKFIETVKNIPKTDLQIIAIKHDCHRQGM